MHFLLPHTRRSKLIIEKKKNCTKDFERLESFEMKLPHKVALKITSLQTENRLLEKCVFAKRSVFQILERMRAIAKRLRDFVLAKNGDDDSSRAGKTVEGVMTLDVLRMVQNTKEKVEQQNGTLESACEKLAAMPSKRACRHDGHLNDS